MTITAQWLQFLIISLAVFRLTRLIIEDTILEPLRERTVFRLAPDSELRSLFDCAWCLSFWLSVLAVISFLLFPQGTTWVALPFAFSSVTGLIASNSK